MSKIKTKFSFLILLILSLCLSAFLFIGQPLTVSAAENNNYISADGTSQLISEDATKLENGITTWATDWYVVDGDVEITGNITVAGNVNLVLKDGCSLTITGMIHGDPSATLIVYGQSEGTGTMNVNLNGEQSNIYAIKMDELTINGGNVNVTATTLDTNLEITGIYSESLSVNGGTVNVSATAIGENKSVDGIYGEHISISGGSVNVTATNTSGTAYGISNATTVSGGTLTLNATGKNASNAKLFDGTMTVNGEGTIVLPTTMNKIVVMDLGITGTGGIKYGNVHIDTNGDCITHEWLEIIKKKDTTNHYTRCCRNCSNGDEETLEPCVYDNACDTSCNICKIVRTIEHTYDENGLCTVCRHSNIPAVDSDGDGYVEIDTYQKLWWFTQQVNGSNINRGLNAELTANIDLAGTCGDGIGNWLPIGNKYSGHFDGQGFTVSNIYITGNDQYIGLFGYVKGATIENVTVTGSVSSTFDVDESTFDNAAAGGFVAYLDDGTIRNCHVDMSVGGANNIGGICGTMYNGTIEDCTVAGEVFVYTQGNFMPESLGGIVALKYDGTVRNCINQATLYTEYDATLGGIAGDNMGGAIENCLNYGTIADKSEYGSVAGGIVGNNTAAVRNCGSWGSITTVSEGEWVGGIVGGHRYDTAVLENCYNVGTVTTGDNQWGHFFGSNYEGTVTNCYYLSDTTTEDGGRTAEQFASGQVAYELNGSTTTDESVWKQTLETDDYPTLTGDNVYYVTSKKCDGTVIENLYSNSSEDIIVHEDTDSDSFCDLCKWLIITKKIFPDEKFRGIMHSAFDDDGDGLLSPEEIAKTKIINLREEEFTDITGIRYFTELTELWGSRCDLQNLDLSGLSKLEVLLLSENGNLASLNLTGCTALTDLYLDGCRNLSSLNMDDCTALKYLYLSNCSKLADSLDVSHLTELTDLDVGYIGLSELDLSKNTKLEELRIDSTGLTTLDLSECSQLNYINYIDTNLTSLELPAHFLLDNSYGAVAYQSEISLDIDQKTMLLDLRDFVADVSRVIGVSENATIVGNYLYISNGATQVNYTYDTGAAEGSLPLPVIINVNNPHTHSFDENGYCADCGLQATIKVDVAFVYKYFTTSSFADALALSREGGWTVPAVITLFDDVTVDEAVSLKGGTQILDLNGHTLTFTATNDTPFTLIEGTFTIRDSSIAQTGTMYHGVSGNENRTVIALTEETALFLESGTLNFSRVEAAISVESGSVMRQSSGLITTPILLKNGHYQLEGGAIETTYPYAFIVDSDGNDQYSIEITGGTISVNDTIGNGGLLDFPQAGCDMETVTITGGTFKNTGGKPFMIRVYHSDAQVSITGGIFEQGLIYTSLWGDDIITLSTVLESGYAYYDADGNIIILTEEQTEIIGKVTVGVCTHSLVYTASENVITETCNIENCSHSATATLNAAENAVYGGEHNEATVTYSENWAGVMLTIAYSGTANDGTTYTGVPVKAGEATASIALGDVTASVNYTVAKAINEWTQAPSIVGWTYGEDYNDPTAIPKFGEMNPWSFSYRAKDTYAWSNIPPTDAGIYEMRARVQATDNWELLETTIEFEVKKATPTAGIFDFTLPAKLDTCDGLAKEAIVTVKEGIEGVGSVTVKYFKDGVELDGAPTTVGTYIVKIQVAEGANYEPATLAADSWTFSVDTPDNNSHRGLLLKSNDNGTHDKICTVCEKVISDDTECSYQRYIKKAMLISPANCTSPKIYYMSCACGQKNGETFEDGYPDSDNHVPEEDDEDCSTAIHCSLCNAVTTQSKSHNFTNACDTDCNNTGCKFTRTTEHRPEADDNDCTTDILCSVCYAVITKGNESHTGGTATCTAKAVCEICGTAYGELDANNHSKTTFVYTANVDGTTHTKKYECCGEIALDNEAHNYSADNKCVCGVEKPILTYTVTVENGTASDGNTSIVVNENGSVTVTANAAPEGKQFKGWSVNGTVISTEQSYTFNATADTTITAVYEDIPKNSGCGSAIGIGSSVVVVALIGLAVIFIRKKRLI